MSELLNAVDQIKSWANKNRAIVVLADELEKIGSLEQAAQEARRSADSATQRVKTADKKLSDVNAAIEAAEVRLAEAVQKAASIRKESSELIESSVARAKSQAAGVISEADRVLQQARSEAAGIISAARSQSEAKKSELKELQKAVEDAAAELHKYTEALRSKKEEALRTMASLG